MTRTAHNEISQSDLRSEAVPGTAFLPKTWLSRLRSRQPLFWRMALGAALLCITPPEHHARAKSPYGPTPYAEWFKSQRRYDGSPCCGAEDAHGAPIQGHDSRHEKLVWRYYTGKQIDGVTDPKDQ